MTVRTAELLMAIITALCSIGLMVKSAELNIGWVEERGPGSGMWPFWLSFGMLLASLATLFRWYRGITPESRSTELYISRDTAMVVGVSAAMIFFSAGRDTYRRDLCCNVIFSVVLPQVYWTSHMVAYNNTDDWYPCIRVLSI